MGVIAEAMVAFVLAAGVAREVRWRLARGVAEELDGYTFRTSQAGSAAEPD